MKTGFFLCVAVLVMTGCKGHLQEEVVCCDETVCLNVSLMSSQTKGIAEEMAVHDVQIFLFNESGVLEAYSRDETGTQSLTLRCTPGSKTVAALVNAPTLDKVASYTELCSFESELLSDNTPESLLMAGEEVYSVEQGVTTQELSVNVSRKVAKVMLNNLYVDFDTEHNKEQGFYLSGIYMVNVAGSLPYFRTGETAVWYNKGCLEDSGDTPLLSYIYNQPIQIEDGTSLEGTHSFYAYPNANSDAEGLPWTPRKTRLVVEAKVGNETCFYPVTIPEIVSDHIYKVNLTVRRPGSVSADDPVEVLQVAGSVVVEEWVATDMIEEEI